MPPRRRVKRKYVVGDSQRRRDRQERRSGYNMPKARRVQKRLERRGEEGIVDPNTGHYASVNPFTNKFLKRSDHPTVQKEVDWYNSPQGADFRREYELKTTNSLGRPRRYYKYKKRRGK